jgi:tRNA A37 threonylcarbamoyladenosine modification protein TsaB
MVQIALALNTTSGTLELAIAQVNPLSYIKHSEWNLERELSVQIHTCLADFMQAHSWSDLTFVAIASGVGSFTSTRIGIVLARTLSEQLGIPVYAASCAEIEKQLQSVEKSVEKSVEASGLAGNSSIYSLIRIGYDRWTKGELPHWSLALPLYS